MNFLTPCFVRVEDAAERKKLIEWLEEIGQEFCIECNELVFSNKYSGLPFNCGTNVDLFRALAAMNDENDREQWFVVLKRVKVIDIEYNDEFWIYDAGKMFFNDVDQCLSKEFFRKATADEIVKYFKKR